MSGEAMADRSDPSRKRQPSLCLLTISHAPDVERFALLRHSLELFAPGFEHVAVVHTEDLPLFSARFGGSPRLRLLPTAAVLPAKVERQRRFWGGRPGRWLRHLEWRIPSHARLYSGWKLQQIAKIEAAAELSADAVMFLDSDTFLTHPLVHGDVFDGEGRLHLRECPAETYEDFAFEVGRQILFRGRLTDRAEAFNYILPTPRFLTRTAATLRSALREMHKDWVQTYYRTDFPAEYNLLGHVARAIEGYAGYAPDPRNRDDWGYDVKFPEQLEPAIALCEQEQGRRQFFLVQSNMRMPPADYVPRLRRMIEALARRQPAAG
ncbi:hypothetical protein GXW77_13040 [Roseomonas alkaliterrae]|uniref:Uncharacterized protein n=1 Tax=Neoroseomonas alkaliterrae TaxID=1452450 RepID=A0A840XWV5_9PROT|nr:DUF6492 family protein [Neoroseomonas alkaliterrae]MBB5688311.1 hypothetical protein [Neoroseomonas alkaliterrae]MBR0677103.1 hypothetical protein [Neoroseomonas alkaliterrae]